MPGGLLNLASEGNLNNILTGNPKKTFFSTTYSKYTNFGMQKFRIDYEGIRKLRNTQDSIFSFNIPRYADLLMDTYFVVTLPNIWSPIREFFPPFQTDISDTLQADKFCSITRNLWPYEFKWIENLGSQMIRSIKYSIDGTIIQEFTGEYLYNMVQRDFSEEKKKLFNEMTGNTSDLNDPANYGGRINNYPNAIFIKNDENNENVSNNSHIFGPEPSIRGKKIYVPLNIWSTLNSKLAFPLISLQYNVLNIEVTCRPIQELFVVRYQPTIEIAKIFNELEIRMYTKTDVSGYISEDEFITKLEETKNIGKYVQPNQLNEYYQIFRFLNPPISPERNDQSMNIHYINLNGVLDSSSVLIEDNRHKNGTISLEEDVNLYQSVNSEWNSDIHLLGNFVFLTDEERRYFAEKEQNYLIKEVYENTYYNITGPNLIKLTTQGLVSSWMWYFQRSDVNLRNQWSNYTNWEYNTIPFKGITNFTSLYKNTDIIDRIYEKSNTLINTNNLANWDISTLANFSLYYIDISFNNDLSSVEQRINGNANSSNLKLNYSKLPKPYLISGPLHIENEKFIMKKWGLLLNGKYREELMDSGITNYIEKYTRTSGSSKDGLYCYNFTLDSNPFKYQPSGAINLSKFNLVQFEIETILPPQNKFVKVQNILDMCGNIIGIRKPTWKMFDYNYNLHIMEERYNILKFSGGIASLVFSR
jgi:hypothetical protein